MKPRTAAEERFARLRSEPEYGEAYRAATRRITMFDDVVRSLDARRQELELTKAEVASRASMPAAAVRRLFSQQEKNPTLTTLAAIADALNLRISVLPREDVAERLSTSSPRPLGTSVPATGAPSRASGTRRRTA
jgi:transcriptional regulator with XRE-family HTH domain